ncbi:hypothetical protein B0H19DRAFT_1071047 [Mycena capillaripes]|nr:hypothetical protein B0H19DRAFT_1071047 [Mycena capillaripes]
MEREPPRLRAPLTGLALIVRSAAHSQGVSGRVQMRMRMQGPEKEDTKAAGGMSLTAGRRASDSTIAKNSITCLGMSPLDYVVKSGAKTKRIAVTLQIELSTN